MSKNGNSKNLSTEKKRDLEHPEKAVERLTKEILKECKLIATGVTESCYSLVEKTKSLMAAEDKLKLADVDGSDSDDSGDDTDKNS